MYKETNYQDLSLDIFCNITRMNSVAKKKTPQNLPQIL